MSNKTIKRLFIGIAVFSVIVGMVDVFTDDRGGYGLSFGVAALLLYAMPFVLLFLLAYGAFKIVRTFTSRSVSTEEKAGTAERLIKTIIYGASGLAIYWILNRIGTALIDL